MKIFPLHLIPNDTKIDFMSWRKPVLILMLVLAVASVGIIVGKGFNYALEFTGGTLVQASFRRPWTWIRCAKSCPGPASKTPRCRTRAAAMRS